MTIAEIRKAMRASNGETIVVKGWGQIKKLGKSYAICGEVDDSDPYTDYSAWNYGWKESWILDDIKRTLGIA